MNLETIKLKIRKNKDIIYTNGYGVLIFMLWSLIKMTLYLVDIAPDISPDMNDILDTIYLSLTLSSSFVQDILTAITGIVAIRVGKKDKPYRRLLFVLSLITFLLSLEFVVGDILLCVVISGYDVAIIIVSVLVDAFFLMMTLFLTISSFKLIRLHKLEKEASLNER